MLITYFVVAFLLFNLQVAILRFHNKKCGFENQGIADELPGITAIAVGWPIVIPLAALVAIGYGIQWLIIKGLETVTTRKTKLTTTTSTSTTSER